MQQAIQQYLKICCAYLFLLLCSAMNHFFSADKIHNGYNFLPEGSVIETDDSGTVINVHPPHTVPGEKVQQFEGIICPGFVNAHCHLELSHLKGAVPEGRGLVPFLINIMQHRNNYTNAAKQEALHNAISESCENGIVAVGDIANTEDTLTVRGESKLHFYTFIECIGFTASFARERFAYSAAIYEAFQQQIHTADRIIRQSIVPHAPYSVSKQLFELIGKYEPASLISIHNEETAAENEYYRYKSGSMRQLFESLNIDDDFFRPSGTTSLQTCLPWLPDTHNVLLVHNTFIEQADIEAIKAREGKVYFCLCPNANYYIERRLPPVDVLAAGNIPVCIGTDSLASNHRLDIFSELKTIHRHFPAIDWGVLLSWATINGAVALKMDPLIGSIETGKRPGFCLIDHQMQYAKRLSF